MSVQHTPAPWTVDTFDRRHTEYRIRASSGMVAIVGNGFNIDKARHDARLIAAAPELLAACERAIPKGVCLTNRNIPDDFSVALDCTMGDLRKIAAAIAKARGDA